MATQGLLLKRTIDPAHPHAPPTWTLEGELRADEPLTQAVLLHFGIQLTPTTCPHCGAPRTCCSGATAVTARERFAHVSDDDLAAIIATVVTAEPHDAEFYRDAINEQARRQKAQPHA